MNRETLKKIDRFLAFGDIKPKEDETDCYYITDKAMQKVIDGFSNELLELHRIVTMSQLIEVRKRAGQVEPVVKPACVNCKYLNIENGDMLKDRIELCQNNKIRLWNLTNCDIDIHEWGCTYFESKSV